MNMYMYIKFLEGKSVENCLTLQLQETAHQIDLQTNQALGKRENESVIVMVSLLLKDES